MSCNRSSFCGIPIIPGVPRFRIHCCAGFPKVRAGLSHTLQEITNEQNREPKTFFLLSIYLSVHLYIYLSIYLFIYLSIHLFIYLSIFLSIYISIYLFIYLSIYLSNYLSINLSIYLSINLSIFLYFYLSFYYLNIYWPMAIRNTPLPVIYVPGTAYLFVYLSICPSLYPSVYLFLLMMLDYSGSEVDLLPSSGFVWQGGERTDGGQGNDDLYS